MPSRWAGPAPSGWAWARLWVLWGLGDGCPAGPFLAVLGPGPWWLDCVAIITVMMGPLGTAHLGSSLKQVGAGVLLLSPRISHYSFC